MVTTQFKEEVLEKHRHHGKISHLTVHPEYQYRGLGNQLLKFAEQKHTEFGPALGS